MAERYTRVFTAKNNLYIEGSPVILSAGALLKDNKTGNVFAQLKIKNISNKKIKALRLNISAFDSFFEKLGEDILFEYIDLSVLRDEEFGQKTLIPLPSSFSRSFNVTVTKIIFEDYDIWRNDRKFLLTIPKPTSLTSVLQDHDLLEQYAMHFNQTAVKPEKVSDLWYCACGALNHQKETECPKCGNKLETLLDCDFFELMTECDQRLEKEKAEQEEAERIAHERATQKPKQILHLAIPAICAVIAIVLLSTMVIIPNAKPKTAADKYNAAVALMEEEKYEEAIEAFEALDGYKDSAEQIAACRTSIKDNAYDAAIVLADEGNIVEAYESLIALDGYKDSAEKARSIYEEYKSELLKVAEVGDYIYLGAYEQDNDTSNGKEDIEWLVLAKSSNKLLIISKYALDCKQYNSESIEVTWETCDLRTWLNETFLNEAFSEAEQSTIQTTKVAAVKNPKYWHGTNPGNDTNDKIFLLNIYEVNRYFASDEARMCVPTAYAIANGAWTSDEYKVKGAATCWWWLRSPGDGQISAAGVSRSGIVNFRGLDVLDARDCVRPAMWINLDDISDGETDTDNIPDSSPNNTRSDYATSEVGDIIELGTYEQDNDTSNGKEIIEWQVLAKENNRILVISKYAIDCKQYNSKYIDITWQTCKLPTWLNETFLNEAFSEEEQSIMQTTEVPADEISADIKLEYLTNLGKTTKNKIFLLSTNEVNKYFASDEARMCVPTPYAIANGAWTSNSYKIDGAATCWWWLRSPGNSHFNTTIVNSSGIVNRDGYGVNCIHVCVRPAMWIDLDA